MIAPDSSGGTASYFDAWDGLRRDITVYYRSDHTTGTSTWDILYPADATDTTYRVEYATSLAWEAEQPEPEEGDRFWHPPYLWVEAPRTERLPIAPTLPEGNVLEQRWPRAPPAAGANNPLPTSIKVTQ